MDLGLSGRVAIVTGGSRGIGFAVAHRLAREGATVAICGRDRARLDAAVAALRADDAQAFGTVADVAQRTATEAFVAAVLERFGRIDILVNNAGTHVRAAAETTTDEQLERQLREKLFGFTAMIQTVLPAMRARRDGRIVNVIGQAARHPHPDRFPSGVTNAALMAMTKSMADAVARDNVRVNSVCPQYIRTELVDAIIEKEQRERGVSFEVAAAGFTRANVLGRLGEPSEVADLVAFLVSDRAGFICGTSVSIDGGYHRYVFG